MLDSIRKRKEHWVSVFIVLAVVAVMAFFGVSKFSGDKASPHSPVAWVNGEAISQRDFYRELEFTLSQYRSALGAQYDEKLLGALQIPQRTLERMVQVKLLTQQAEKMGFFVSDEELAASIRSIPYFQKDGKFDAEAYSKIPNRGLEERKQREQMITGRLQSYMAGRIKVLPSELKVSQVLKNTQVDLQVAAIDFNALAPKQDPSPEAVKEALQNESLLKTKYEMKKADFTTKARLNIRQIRVGIPFQASADTRKKAQDKMVSIKSQLTPSNFESVAKSQSDDEFAKKGGARGWISQGVLEKQMEDAALKLSPNQISEVIETPSGLFLVQLLEKQDSQVKPLEEVKQELAMSIAKEQARNRFIESKKKAWEEMLVKNQPLDSELRKAGVTLKKTGPFSIGQGSIPTIGAVESMVDAIFELSPEHPFPKRLFFYQDKYYYLKLIATTPPKPEALAKDTESAEKTLANLLQGEVFKDWVTGLEKQASIKLEDKFDQKKGSRPTTL